MGSRHRAQFYANPSKRSAQDGQTPAHAQVVDPDSQSPVSLATTFAAGGVSVQHVRVNTPQGFNIGWQGKPHYIALHDLRARDCEIYTDDHSVARERDLRGRLAFIPSGCAAGGWIVPTADPQSFTSLYVDAAQMEDDLGGLLQRVPLQPRVYFSDAALISTLTKLRDCLSADKPLDRLYVESLCMLGAVELCRMSPRIENEPGMLSRRLTNRVAEFIDQHLHRDIGLEDLAQISNLSRFHFLRAFRRTMQETPYQHLLRRRVERAQQLLRDGDRSVAEIALAVGFKSSNQFAATFRKMTNCSPTEFRATLRR